MKHQIKIVPWCTNCDDGFCNDYGSQLIINNVIVDDNFYDDEKWLNDFLKALNIVDYEITIKGDAE